MIALRSYPTLRALLGGLDSLPKPPEIYAELVALANRSTSTVTEIATWLSVTSRRPPRC